MHERNVVLFTTILTVEQEAMSLDLVGWNLTCIREMSH